MILPYRLRLSVPEAFLLRALLRAEAFFPPGLAWQYRVAPYVLDAAVPSLKVDIEVDGWRHKSDRRSYGPEHDAQRDAFLKSEGWKVFRFEARQVCDKVVLPVNDDRYYPGWKADQCVWALLTTLGLTAPEPHQLRKPERVGSSLMSKLPFTREPLAPPFHADTWPGKNGW